MLNLSDANYLSEFYNQLLDNKEKNIYFYGASEFLKYFLSTHNMEPFNIKGVIDFDAKRYNETFEFRYGKTIQNCPIISPSIINSLSENDKIVFSICNNSVVIYNSVLKNLTEEKQSLFLPNIFEKVNIKIQDECVEKFSSNKIFIVNSKGERKQVSYIKGLTVEWLGENSTIEIHSPIPIFFNAKTTLKSNCNLVIKSSPFDIKNFRIIFGNNSNLNIGHSFSCNGANIYTRQNNTTLNIGNDCMFSSEILIRPSDQHSIHDENNNVINKGDTINIGNHVWLCQKTTILKNTSIADNTVVALGSIVAKNFIEPNTIIAGIPAKIVKRNTNWSREST